MSKIKKLYLLIAYVVILLSSCNSENKSDQYKEVSQKEDTFKNDQYHVIRNQTMDIGQIEMIYIFTQSWDWQSNLTLGIDDKTINKKFQEMLPDSIKSIDDLPMGYIPYKKFIKQDALDYLSEYMKDNCDTLIYESSYKNGNTIYDIYLVGKNGKIDCVYGEPERVVEYYEGLLEWIKLYPERNAFKDIIPGIEYTIEYGKKAVNNNN